MRKTILFLILFPLFSFGQSYDLHIDTLIQKVNIDTLQKYVNELSGETEVFINGEYQRITHRIDAMGNELAGDYIKNILSKHNLTINDQEYSLEGRNIIAYQTGDTYPDEHFIICAHYDAIPNFAADDNASGTAAVLETARVLSQYSFPYSIVYALWDQEEVGLLGSNHFAHQSQSNDIKIKGVLNLDMIAYNTTSNNRFDIHVRPYNKSVDLAYYFSNLCTTYDLNLSPIIFNPGSDRSDHRPFWNRGFSAIFVIEPSSANLFNPYYHSNQDRIDKFNMSFFHEMSKLSLGGIASLANGESYTSIADDSIYENIALKIYPNPAIGEGSIELTLNKATHLTIDVFNIDGVRIYNIEDRMLSPNTYTYKIEDLNLYSGMYFISIKSSWGSINQKFIYIK